MEISVLQVEIEEGKLIDDCMKGDRIAQQALYDRYCGKMYAVALRYVKAELEAEDILQESFIKIFQHLHTFKRASSLYYWMKRVVVNAALNHQRSKLYLHPMVDVNTLYDWKADSMAISNYSHQELLAMIQELPDGCRIIFNLYAIEGYKHHEIAKMLEISEGTSKSQYSRAKILLQEKVNSRNQIRYGQAR